MEFNRPGATALGFLIVKWPNQRRKVRVVARPVLIYCQYNRFLGRGVSVIFSNVEIEGRSAFGASHSNAVLGQNNKKTVAQIIASPSLYTVHQ